MVLDIFFVFFLWTCYCIVLVDKIFWEHFAFFKDCPKRNCSPETCTNDVTKFVCVIYNSIRNDTGESPVSFGVVFYLWFISNGCDTHKMLLPAVIYEDRNTYGVFTLSRGRRVYFIYLSIPHRGILSRYIQKLCIQNLFPDVYDNINP